MEHILTPAAMKAADTMAAERYSMPSLILMENAGRCVIDKIETIYGTVADARILVVCGKGNNGGDGFAAARHALDRGAWVTVVMMESEQHLSGDPLIMARILAKSVHPKLTIVSSFSAARLHKKEFTFLVDALFGTSFHGAVKGKYLSAITWMNDQSAVRVAVDVPSGLNAETGSVDTAAVRADLTVTMAALKPGFFLDRGREYAGRVSVAEISMPRGALDGCSVHIYRLGDEDVRRDLPVRSLTAHKYSVGKLCVIAGSRGLTGAALLSAEAAMRSGAGAVILCTPASELSAVAKRTLEVMPFPAASTPEGTFALDAVYELSAKIDWADVVLLGPGIAPHAETDIVVRGIIAATRAPIVIDAGGLTALVGDPGVLRERKKYPTVLTPHIGEFARLVNRKASEIEHDKIEIARAFARDHGVILVLKGAPTLVAAPDGTVCINATGNPGMATAGSGDVLAGVIASLLAQGNDAFTAARNAVYLHGRAGDLSAREKTQSGMIASDIIDQLPSAFFTFDETA
jgi:ADP-dependent NAD(P)H-hydrate dehydratase / NAD(P)H-hydrate epimerase